jgi:hypothetical protein
VPGRFVAGHASGGTLGGGVMPIYVNEGYPPSPDGKEWKHVEGCRLLAERDEEGYGLMGFWVIALLFLLFSASFPAGPS